MRVGSNGSLARWVRDASQPYHWRRRQPLSSSRGDGARNAAGTCGLIAFHEGNAEAFLFRTTMWMWRCRLRC